MFCLRHLRYVTMKDYPILLLVWVCNSIDTYSIEDDSFEIKLNLFIHFGAIFWWFMHLRDMGIPWGERSKERRWTMFVLIENFYAIYRLLSCQKIYCSCGYVSWNICSFLCTCLYVNVLLLKRMKLSFPIKRYILSYSIGRTNPVFDYCSSCFNNMILPT